MCVTLTLTLIASGSGKMAWRLRETKNDLKVIRSPVIAMIFNLRLREQING